MKEIEHKGYKSKPKELKMDHLDHCEAGAFRFFKIHVDAEDADANLLIETEALSDATTPDAQVEPEVPTSKILKARRGGCAAEACGSPSRPRAGGGASIQFI